MSWLKKMLGFKRFTEEKPVDKRDPIAVDLSRAVQKNEQAGERARAALEEIKMSQTLSQIAGRMK